MSGMSWDSSVTHGDQGGTDYFSCTVSQNRTDSLPHANFSADPFISRKKWLKPSSLTKYFFKVPIGCDNRPLVLSLKTYLLKEPQCPSPPRSHVSLPRESRKITEHDRINSVLRNQSLKSDHIQGSIVSLCFSCPLLGPDSPAQYFHP